MGGARAESIARGRGRAKEKVSRQLTVVERAFVDTLVRAKKKSPTETLRRVNQRRQKKQVREVENSTVYRSCNGARSQSWRPRNPKTSPGRP